MRLVAVSMLTILGFSARAHAQDIVHLDLGDRPFLFDGPALHLDLTGDGRPDAILRSGVPCCDDRTGVVLDTENGGVEFLVGLGFGADAPALAGGDPISAQRSPWNGYAWLAYTCCHSHPTGQWNTPRDSYVGYRLAGSPTRYGWLRISNADGTLHGFVVHEAAFNSEGNPIFAGEGGALPLKPWFAPGAGTYSDYQTVTVSAIPAEATIHFTLDGSAPGPASPVVPNGGSIDIVRTATTLRAVAIRPDLTISDIASAAYTLIAAEPVLGPAYGPGPVSVTMTCETHGAAIYYTTDGTDPSPQNGVSYTVPVSLSAGAEVRAAAFKAGLEPSAIASRRYWVPDVVYVDPPDVSMPTDEWLVIDLDLDGSTDVGLHAGSDGWFTLTGAAVGRFDGWNALVEVVAPGTIIGPDSGIVESFCDRRGCSFPVLFNPFEGGGDWTPGFTGVAGVRFVGADGEHRFGWIRLRAPSEEAGAVFDWAFQAAPSLPIIGGDTGAPVCPPFFYSQPSGQRIEEGEPIVLSAIAAGQGLTYRWSHNGVPIVDDGRISGGETRELAIASAVGSDEGVYTVMVMSDCGSVTSRPAVLSVTRRCAPLSGGVLRVDRDSQGALVVPGFGAAVPTEAITIEFWQFAVEAAWQATFNMYPVNEASRFLFHGPFADGRVYWDCGACNPDFGPCTPAYTGRLDYEPTEPIVGSWQHFALVASRSGDFMRIYRNGVLEAERVGAAPRLPDLADLYIGGAPSYHGFFTGRIDEFRVWNSARTGPQIAADYDRAVEPSTPGLFAYYRFDEGQGTVASDLTGHGHDGTLVGGASLMMSTRCPTCPADFNRDGGIDGGDVEAFFAAWEVGGSSSDVNDDGSVDGGDVETFLVAWEAGGC